MTGGFTEREMQGLRYLAKQPGPIWSGVLAAEQRGERITDPDIQRWKQLGLIAVQGNGYVITKQGRIACGADLPRCRYCGREF